MPRARPSFFREESNQNQGAFPVNGKADRAARRFANSLGVGIGVSSRPANIASNSPTNSAWIRPFDASTSRLFSANAPSAKFVTRPPAYSTSRIPAAVSHGFRLNSQKASSRPAATYARSSAADPARRTPCERSVNSW